MNTLVEQLISARDSLTLSNWRKGAYFKFENGALCMCAHGAVQAQVNPVCAEAVRDNVVCGLATAPSTVGPEHGAGVAARDRLRERAADLQSIWNNRPTWVKQDHIHIHNGENYGNQDAHYLMGMVGFTTSFNDAESTTFEMIIAKFNEAIELAERLTREQE